MNVSLKSAVDLLGGAISHEERENNGNRFSVSFGGDEEAVIKNLENSGLITTKSNQNGISVVEVTDRGHEYYKLATIEAVVKECERMSLVLGKELDYYMFGILSSQASRNVISSI